MWRYLITLLFLVRSSHGERYGDPCDPQNDSCFIYSGQSCQETTTGNFTCACLRPEEMTYDESSLRCLVKVDGNCELLLEDQTFPGRLDCEDPWASCSDWNIWTDGPLTCKCDPYSHSEVNGSCVPSYRSECGDSSECLQSEGLVCFRGTCDCGQRTNEYFDMLKRRCFSLVGTSCAGLSDSTGHDTDIAVCAEDARSSSGFSVACDAAKGVQEDFARKCRPYFGQRCSMRYPANTFDEGRCNLAAGLECNGNKCECAMGEGQKWDEGRRTCVSLEGQQCNIKTYYPQIGTLDCDKGLVCSPVDLAGRLGQGLLGICRQGGSGEGTSTSISSSSLSASPDTNPTTPSAGTTTLRSQTSVILFAVYTYYGLRNFE